MIFRHRETHQTHEIKSMALSFLRSPRLLHFISFVCFVVAFLSPVRADPLSKKADIDFFRDVPSRNLKGLATRSDGRLVSGPTFAELDVKAPVYVGDTLEVVVEVIESRAASSGGRGLVTTRNSVRNQRDEEVLIYTPKRLLRGSAG